MDGANPVPFGGSPAQAEVGAPKAAMQKAVFKASLIRTTSVRVLHCFFIVQSDNCKLSNSCTLGSYQLFRKLLQHSPDIKRDPLKKVPQHATKHKHAICTDHAVSITCESLAVPSFKSFQLLGAKRKPVPSFSSLPRVWHTACSLESTTVSRW